MTLRSDSHIPMTLLDVLIVLSTFACAFAVVSWHTRAVDSIVEASLDSFTTLSQMGWLLIQGLILGMAFSGPAILLSHAVLYGQREFSVGERLWVSPTMTFCAFLIVGVPLSQVCPQCIVVSWVALYLMTQVACGTIALIVLVGTLRAHGTAYCRAWTDVWGCASCIIVTAAIVYIAYIAVCEPRVR
ncbi:MAG: hypothetical protein GXX96_00010 [Planctomycetaceae bacterium]|nr:hypothetical protein [Planctomycetaceae bacterium]